MKRRKRRTLIRQPSGDEPSRWDWVASAFRKFSGILVLIGLLTTFNALLFMDVKIGRNGRPKPPLWVQLMWSGGIFTAGMPGAAWGLVRALQKKQKTPWE